MRVELPKSQVARVLHLQGFVVISLRLVHDDHHPIGSFICQFVDVEFKLRLRDLSLANYLIPRSDFRRVCRSCFSVNSLLS